MSRHDSFLVVLDRYMHGQTEIEMKRKRNATPVPPPLPRSRKLQCFRCDGTGLICDTCGESQRACCCEVDGLGTPFFSPCDDCKGTGE